MTGRKVRRRRIRVALASAGAAAFAGASALSSLPWTPVLVAVGSAAWISGWLVFRL